MVRYGTVPVMVNLILMQEMEDSIDMHEVRQRTDNWPIVETAVCHSSSTSTICNFFNVVNFRVTHCLRFYAFMYGCRR
jgi:hypothetical protein